MTQSYVGSDTVPGKRAHTETTGQIANPQCRYLDGYGLLVVGTYVSFMSGNTTMAGLKIGEVDFLAALSPVIAFACFVTGCSRRSKNPSLKWPAGLAGSAGVKMRQQMAFVEKRQGPGDEGRGALRSGSFCGSD